MIDFIHIEINDVLLIEKISNNPLLTYKQNNEYKSAKTGKLYKLIIKEYRNLKFAFSNQNNILNISGSIHYFFNNGIHNANDFYFNDFKQVIKGFCIDFGINPNACKIRSMEYGINIKPAQYDTKTILQNTFYHTTTNRRLKFKEPIYKPYKQAGCRNNDYALKIYDKENQFPIHTNSQTLRFEIKYFRMRELNKKGVVFLSDLLNIKNQLFLRNQLIKRFNEILFFDFTINKEKLNAKDLQRFHNFSNPIYWETMANKNNKRNVFNNAKKRLQQFVIKYCENIQKQISQIIEDKTFVLLNMPVYNGLQLIKNATYPTHFKREKMCAFPHIYIGWNYNEKLAI